MKNLKSFENFKSNEECGICSGDKKNKLPKKGTPEWHQLQIAKKTMKMNNAMASVLGGMNREEAKEILKKYGLSVNESDSFTIDDAIRLAVAEVEKKKKMGLIITEPGDQGLLSTEKGDEETLYTIASTYSQFVDNLNTDKAYELILKRLEEIYPQYISESFEDDVEVQELSEPEEYKINYISDLIKKGYTQGFDPTWKLTVELFEDGKINETDYEHIATKVKEGFNEGEIQSIQKNGNVVSGWWTIEIE